MRKRERDAARLKRGGGGQRNRKIAELQRKLAEARRAAGEEGPDMMVRGRGARGDAGERWWGREMLVSLGLPTPQAQHPSPMPAYIPSTLALCLPTPQAP